MLGGDVMGRYPAFVRLGEDVRRAAELIGVSEVGHLVVLDHEGRYVGALAEADLVRALLPRADDVLARGGTLSAAFSLFVQRGRDLAGRPIDPLVQRDAVTLRTTQPLAEAAVVMTERGLRRVPVVDDGVLRGTLSQSDICRAVLQHAGLPGD